MEEDLILQDMQLKQQRFREGAEEEVARLLKKAKSGTETKRIQCVLLGTKGLTSENISVVTGYHPQHVRRVWQQYREKGKKALIGERRGSGKGNAHLERREEKEFLSCFVEKANRSGILIVSEVHEAHKKRLGKSIPLSSTYNLLHRHNWRKITPRPQHPQGDKEKQEEYKALVFPPANHQGKD